MVNAIAAADVKDELKVVVAANQTTVSNGDQPLLVYQATPNPYKVYVSKWYTPGGLQVLRDSPHDHVHHHALMYAIGVDGVDFWGEVPAAQPGKQIPEGKPRVSAESIEGRSFATLIQDIQWRDAVGQTLLAEQRKLTLDLNAVPEASLLTWSSTFRPAEGKDQVELWGRHYFGLGLRMVTSMDQDGRMINPTGEEGEIVRGTERLVQAPWCAYTAKIDGRPVTIAMLDHPKNDRPATWFTMTGPFAYLAATLDLKTKPISLPADKTLQLQYGLALWDGEKTAEEIASAREKWLKTIGE